MRPDAVLEESCYTLISSCESYGSKAALGVVKGGTFGMFYGGDVKTCVGSKCKAEPNKWCIVSFASTGIDEEESGILFSVRSNNVTDSNLIIKGARAGPYLAVGASGKHEASDAFNGDIAEIIMYSRVLSAEEWVKTATYLTSKYRHMLAENNRPWPSNTAP